MILFFFLCLVLGRKIESGGGEGGVAARTE